MQIMTFISQKGGAGEHVYSTNSRYQVTMNIELGMSEFSTTITC